MTSREVFIFQIFLFFCVTLCHSNSHYFVRKQWIDSAKNITGKSKVKITVYYETLCPASVNFFNGQLGPVVEMLASHLEVNLIPYGHAETRKVRNQYRFRCQHGPPECYGNKLHACSIDAMQNTTKSVQLNACLMRYTIYNPNFGYDYASALYWCGYLLNENVNGVRKCVNSEHGTDLLVKFGEETHRVKPRFVPYVLLDDSSEDQEKALENLISVICQKLEPLPEACRRFVIPYRRYSYA